MERRGRSNDKAQKKKTPTNYPTEERRRESEKEKDGGGNREDSGRTSVHRKFPLSDLLEQTTTRGGPRLLPPEQQHDLRRGGSGTECQD